MHIEPGIVTGVKMALSYATAAGAAGVAAKAAFDTLKENGALALAGRSTIGTALVFSFFQLMPHFAVGVSEVHLILGSTLFLMFGAAPAAIGLVMGLFLQGLFFAPFDLPQYFINATTLLVPLLALRVLATRIIAPDTKYVDLSYKQALALSTAYQGGIVAWVGFWAFYGQGFTATNIAAVLSFGSAYMLVVLVEPIIDLTVLGVAKSARGLNTGALFNSRLHNAV